jgi:hypothetical protein
MYSVFHPWCPRGRVALSSAARTYKNVVCFQGNFAVTCQQLIPQPAHRAVFPVGTAPTPSLCFRYHSFDPFRRASTPVFVLSALIVAYSSVVPCVVFVASRQQQGTPTMSATEGDIAMVSLSGGTIVCALSSGLATPYACHSQTGGRTVITPHPPVVAVEMMPNSTPGGTESGSFFSTAAESVSSALTNVGTVSSLMSPALDALLSQSTFLANLIDDGVNALLNISAELPLAGPICHVLIGIIGLCKVRPVCGVVGRLAVMVHWRANCSYPSRTQWCTKRMFPLSKRGCRN